MIIMAAREVVTSINPVKGKISLAMDIQIDHESAIAFVDVGKICGNYLRAHEPGAGW